MNPNTSIIKGERDRGGKWERMLVLYILTFLRGFGVMGREK